MAAAKKPKTPAKKAVTPSKSAKKAAPEQKNVLQKIEDAVGGAGKAIGAAYDKSQEARRGIWKDVKRPGKG